jgi:hypothetical protein
MLVGRRITWLADLCPLAPEVHPAQRGHWAPKALPFVFGAVWLLALAVTVGGGPG